MKILRMILVALAVAALVACDQQAPRTATPQRASAVSQELVTEPDRVDAIEQRVRMEQTDKRIGELEAQVAELRDNPQTLQVDLLKKRLEAVEARVYAKSSGDTNRASVGNSAAVVTP